MKQISFLEAALQRRLSNNQHIRSSHELNYNSNLKSAQDARKHTVTRRKNSHLQQDLSNVPKEQLRMVQHGSFGRQKQFKLLCSLKYCAYNGGPLDFRLLMRSMLDTQDLLGFRG